MAKKNILGGTNSPELVKVRDNLSRGIIAKLETQERKRKKVNEGARSKCKEIVPPEFFNYQPTRKLAKEKGDKYYFTGVPCVHGHIDLRATNSPNCNKCADIRWEKKRKDTEEKKRLKKPSAREIAVKENKKTFFGWCNYCQKQVEKLTINGGCINCLNRRRREYGKTKAGKKASERQNLKKAKGGERYEEHIKYRQQRYVENKDEINKVRRKYIKQRRDKDPQYRFFMALRNRTSSIMKSLKVIKANTSIKLIGCTRLELKNYMEKQFKEGMNWDNYGSWHVDHIRPCNAFDLRIKDQQYICFNFRNLEPLWAKDNLEKGDHYDFDDEVLWIKKMRDLGFKGNLFPKYK